MSDIGVGLVGYKFMGRTHSNAYRQVARYFDVPLKPRMVAVAGRDEASVKAAAEDLGWDSYVTDYHDLLERDDIQLIDVASPGYTHKDIVVAALEAGKHVLCEKPLANTLDEAQEMLTAARKAGTIAMVNFNYRRVPAIRFAKRIIDEGKIGELLHFRGNYLQDWIMDPEFPLVWRLRKELAGSGALGDIAAHSVDLAQYLVGDIVEVTGMAKTFVKERPLEATGEVGSGLSAKGSAERGEVTVDDAVSFLAWFANGAMGSFNATRFAAGRRNANTFEINGTRGSIAFNLERMNELEVFFADDAEGFQGFRTINVTEPAHPYTANWWPAGHIIGYEHTFIHAVKDLLEGIASGEQPRPSFEDGFRNQAVLDAVERSAESRQWTAPREPSLDS